MKYFVFILFLLFAIPAQAKLIYALDVYAPQELIGEDCHTVLTVHEHEYAVVCVGHEGTHTTEYRYDKNWRHIKKVENTE